MTPDKWSAAFKHIFCATGKARWHAWAIEHGYALPILPLPRLFSTAVRRNVHFRIMTKM